MTYIEEYWENKESRKKIAIEHTAKMQNKYRKEISDSIKKTQIFGTEFNYQCKTKKHPSILVVDMNSVDAICKYKHDKTAVLNFASYKNPGGMFLNGSKAQEECLCHESFLYNVLKSKESYYDWNKLHKNKALYLNRALYSPNVLFRESIYCDVITCAAPNKSAAQKYQNVSDEKNREVLEERIRFVLDIAASNNVKTLILGAYGAGVFGQDGTDVAELFKKYLDNYNFENVIFAIPKSMNLNKFRKVLC